MIKQKFFKNGESTKSNGSGETIQVGKNNAQVNNTTQIAPTSDAPKTQVNWGNKKDTEPKAQESDNNNTSSQKPSFPVVGWLVIIEGNGLGNDLKIIPGMNTIGRNESNNISIDFGDMSISREKHCNLIFDYKNKLFFLTHNEGGNLSYINDDVVLQPASLKANDIIGIGDTKLKFIPFCDNDFCWDL